MTTRRGSDTCARRAAGDDALGALLAIDVAEPAPFVRLRAGNRSRAVLVTADGVRHRFDDRAARVVVKLYKGDGGSAAARRYRRYHRDWFARTASLAENPNVQQSLDASVCPVLGPHALLGYVEGDELARVLEDGRISSATAHGIVRDLLHALWIPLWASGLRFKDCHPGNFVLTPSGGLAMIDTEQMRMDVDERLHRPTLWTARAAHERSGLSRLPGLVQRVLLAVEDRPLATRAAARRAVLAALEASALPERLRALGRAPNAAPAATLAADRFLAALAPAGLLA